MQRGRLNCSIVETLEVLLGTIDKPIPWSHLFP